MSDLELEQKLKWHNKQLQNGMIQAMIAIHKIA